MMSCDVFVELCIDEKFAGIVGMQRSRLELSTWLLGPPSLAHPNLVVALTAAHPSASGALGADRTAHSQAFIAPVLYTPLALMLEPLIF